MLVAAPWPREVYAARVARVVERYDRLVSIASSGARRGQVGLLLQHPGALTELERTPEAALAEHGRRAREELDRLERGAALPPPPEDTDRVRVLALADLGWLVHELRALRRLSRRHRAAEDLLAAYLELGRQDSLPSPTPALVAAAAAIPGAQVRRRMLPLIGLRYRRPELPGWLLPTRAAPARVRVGASGDLGEGEALRVQAFGRTVAVFRHEGRLFALDDACPHRGGPLGKGDLERGRVLCPLHGWAFDLETGAYEEQPSLCVRTYRIEEADGALWLLGPPSTT